MRNDNRWVPMTLVLWAVPAFIFWLLIGFYLNLRDGREQSERLDSASKVLENLLAVEFLEKNLDIAFREEIGNFRKTWTRATSLASWTEGVIRRYPKGAVQCFLFDSDGKLAFPEKTDIRVPLEEVFRIIRTPWREKLDLDDVTIGTLEKRLLNPVEGNLVGMWMQPDRLRIFEFVRPPLPSLSYWHFSEDPGEGEPAGFLFFADRTLFPPDFAMLETIRGYRGSVLLGAVDRRGRETLSPGLATETFRSCLASVMDQPSGKAHSGNLLVVADRLKDGRVLAMIHKAVPPRNALLAVFLLYLGGSFAFITFLKRYSAGRVIRLSLATKLLVLMAAGILLPLSLAGLIGLLLDGELWNAHIEENRRKGLANLDKIDLGFENALRDRELELRRLSGDFVRPLPVSEIIASLYTMQRQFRIEEFFMLSSTSAFLAFEEAQVGAGYVPILMLPAKERRDVIDNAMKRGWSSPSDWITMLYSPRDLTWGEVRHACKNGKEHLRKIFSILGREVMNEYNSRRGFPPVPLPGGESLVVSGLFESDLQEFAGVAKNSVSSLQRTGDPVGEGFLFSSVIPSAEGADCFLVIVLKYYNLTWDYFRKVCLETGSGRVFFARALRHLMSPGFPDDRLTNPLLPVRMNLLQKPGEPVRTTMTLEGREVDLVARSGNIIPDSMLVEITPMEVLRDEFRPLRRRMVFLLLLAVVFCLTLTGLALRRLLEPISTLGGGMAAMGRRDFGFRLSDARADEFGQLFASFNRTMAHLADMELAAAVQARIFPASSLEREGFLITSQNRMTQATGGDFIDYFPLPDGRIVAALGDVSGHGIGAALVTAMAKAAVGRLCPLFPDEPEKVLERINALFIELLAGKRTMTMVLGILDPRTGMVRLANAGHCSPALLAEGRPPELIHMGSYPLGASRRGKYKHIDVPLEGGTLVFYSDGLVEALDTNGQPIGYTRFPPLIQAAVAEAPRAPGKALFRIVSGLTGPGSWDDDASALFLGPSPKP